MPLCVSSSVPLCVSLRYLTCPLPSSLTSPVPDPLVSVFVFSLRIQAAFGSFWARAACCWWKYQWSSRSFSISFSVVFSVVCSFSLSLCLGYEIDRWQIITSTLYFSTCTQIHSTTGNGYKKMFIAAEAWLLHHVRNTGSLLLTSHWLFNTYDEWSIRQYLVALFTLIVEWA